MISTIVFAMLLTTVSCNSGSIKTNTLNGELVFQTIFLGADYYLSSIPELEDIYAQFEIFKENDPQIQERINEFWLSLRDNIIQENPNYFIEFGRDIASGDHLRIINTLEYAGQVMKDAVQSMPEYQEMMATEEVKEIREVLSATDFEEYVDENGIILKEKLIDDLLNKMNGAQGGKYQQSSKQTCLIIAVVAAVVFLAAGAVEVIGVIAGGFLLALYGVIAMEWAIVNQVAFWDGGGKEGPLHQKRGKYSGYKSLKYEMMINSIAQNFSR